MSVLAPCVANSRGVRNDLRFVLIEIVYAAPALYRTARSLFRVVNFNFHNGLPMLVIPSPSCAFASSAASSFESIPLIDMLPLAAPKVFRMYCSQIYQFCHRDCSRGINVHHPPIAPPSSSSHLLLLALHLEANLGPPSVSLLPLHLRLDTSSPNIRRINVSTYHNASAHYSSH